MRAGNLNCVAVVILAGLCVFFAPLAYADPEKDAKAPPEMKLPPGWTEADMNACMLAGVPGKMHEYLAKGVGVWKGKNTMWFFPGAEPIKSESIATVTAIMGGRYVKSESAGDMPGMGPFNGMGIFGFDNVSQKFVATWIDSFGTGIMTGTGQLSQDGKILTWNLTENSPITKQPSIIREVDTITGPDSTLAEMFGPDPKTGREFKMMTIEMTRVAEKAPAAGHAMTRLEKPQEPAAAGADSPVDAADLKILQDRADEARLHIELAKTELAQAEVELKRTQEMFDKKVVGIAELDKAKLDFRISEIRLELAENQWTLRQDEVAAKRARMDEKKRQDLKH